MNIVSERAPASSSATAAAATSADKFLGGLSSRSGRESSRRTRDEDPEERKARDLEAAFERSREKERREAEAAVAAADRTYKDHVRRLERAERCEPLLRIARPNVAAETLSPVSVSVDGSLKALVLV